MQNEEHYLRIIINTFSYIEFYIPLFFRHKIEKKALPPFVESLKKKANQYFEKEQYTKAIILYNQAIYRAPQASMLFGNRAAAYMKRKW